MQVKGPQKRTKQVACLSYVFEISPDLQVSTRLENCLTDSHVRHPVSSGHIQRLQAAALGGQRGDSSISHASRSSDIQGSEAFLLREMFLNRETGVTTGAERRLFGPLLHRS